MDRESHGHSLGSLENLAGKSLEVFGGSPARHVVGQLVVRHLGSGGVVDEPVSGSSNGGHADVDSNSHVSEEQPGSDKSFVRSSGLLLHDVEIWGVEGEGGGGETVSDQVNPQELHGDQSFGKAESGGEEDADDFANVGGDEITDELLHVVVDSAALFDS